MAIAVIFPMTIRTREELANVRHVPGGTSLVADLDHVTAMVAFVHGAHLLGLRNAQRHGFFEIDVLARRDRIAELLRVKMLGSRDDHRIHGGIVQQTAVIGMDRGAGRYARGRFQPPGIDIGKSRDLSIGACPDMIDQLHPAIARADDADADAFICSQDTGRTSGQGPGQAIGDLPNEFPAGIHVFSVYQGTRPRPTPGACGTAGR